MKREKQCHAHVLGGPASHRRDVRPDERLALTLLDALAWLNHCLTYSPSASDAMCAMTYAVMHLRRAEDTDMLMSNRTATWSGNANGPSGK